MLDQHLPRASRGAGPDDRRDGPSGRPRGSPGAVHRPSRLHQADRGPGADRGADAAPLHRARQGAAVPTTASRSFARCSARRTLKSFTEHTMVSLPQLEKACAKVRADGYATDEAEYLDEVRCVAAPIRDQDRKIIAAIGVSAPASRFPKSRAARLRAPRPRCRSHDHDRPARRSGVTAARHTRPWPRDSRDSAPADGVALETPTIG